MRGRHARLVLRRVDPEPCVRDEYVEKLARRVTERILLGDPFEDATTMGRLNNEPLAKTMYELVPFFFGADYGGAVVVTRILLIGAFLFAIRRLLADGAKGMGLPGLGSIAELGSWILLVSLLAVLMPPFGLACVATAIAISSALSALRSSSLRCCGNPILRTSPRREAGRRCYCRCLEP